MCGDLSHVVIRSMFSGPAGRLDAEQLSHCDSCDRAPIDRRDPVSQLRSACCDHGSKEAVVATVGMQIHVVIVPDFWLPTDAGQSSRRGFAGNADRPGECLEAGNVRRLRRRRRGSRSSRGDGRAGAGSGQQHRDRNTQGTQRTFQHSLLEFGGQGRGILCRGAVSARTPAPASSAGPPRQVLRGARACRRGRRGSGIPDARRRGNGGPATPMRAASPACRRCAPPAPPRARARAP